MFLSFSNIWFSIWLKIHHLQFRLYDCRYSLIFLFQSYIRLPCCQGPWASVPTHYLRWILFSVPSSTRVVVQFRQKHKHELDFFCKLNHKSLALRFVLNCDVCTIALVVFHLFYFCKRPVHIHSYFCIIQSQKKHNS